MIKINGIKLLEGFDYFRKVKARGEHSCSLCKEKIHVGEDYYWYIESETGYEKKACFRHLDKKRIEEFETLREKYTKKRERGEEIKLETDASGSSGERWAFIAYLNDQEIHREHGYTPDEICDITPAEGYAILKAIQWLQKAEEEGMVENDLPVVVGSDNYAVSSKLETLSERGRYEWLWHELNQALLPYRRSGRLFLGIESNINADRYAQKSTFRDFEKARGKTK